MTPTPRAILLASALLATVVPATAETKADATRLDDERVNALVKAYIEQHPDVVFNAVNAYVADQHTRQQRERDAQAMSGASDLLSSEGMPVLGRPDAKVTMVYVLDVACGFCRKSTPTLAALLARNPDLRIVQRYVSFLTKDSDYGGRVAMIVARRYPDRYPEFYTRMMTQTGRLDADLIDHVVAEALGDDALPLVKADATAPDNAYGKLVALDNQVTKRLGIEGTPFMMIQGAGGIGIFRGEDTGEHLQAAIDTARTAKGAAAAR